MDNTLAICELVHLINMNNGNWKALRLPKPFLIKPPEKIPNARSWTC